MHLAPITQGGPIEVATRDAAFVRHVTAQVAVTQLQLLITLVRPIQNALTLASALRAALSIVIAFQITAITLPVSACLRVMLCQGMPRLRGGAFLCPLLAVSRHPIGAISAPLNVRYW